MKAKTHLSQNKSRGGFTLVEMLVVISMIAALAGISFPVYKGIQKKVERQSLAMTFNALNIAIDNFETEYNYLPYITAAYPAADNSLIKGEDGTAESLITCLVAPENASAVDMAANFKRIQFFDGPEAKGGPGNYYNGLVISGNSSKAALYRPWGDQYRRWRFDYDLSGEVTAWPGGVVKSKWMIYDPGPDGNFATDDDFFKGTVPDHKPGPDNVFGTSDDEYP